LIRSGKVRHVGVSNHGVDDMEQLRVLGRLETLQPRYHMFARDIEDAVLPYAAEGPAIRATSRTPSRPRISSSPPETSAGSRRSSATPSPSGVHTRKACDFLASEFLTAGAGIPGRGDDGTGDGPDGVEPPPAVTRPGGSSPGAATPASPIPR
jgi:hypothetical protein